MLPGVGAGVEDWVGVRGEACLGVRLEFGPLADVETVGWRQDVGLWDLLKEEPGMGDVEGVGVRVGVTSVMVCVGVWEGVEVRVRAV